MAVNAMPDDPVSVVDTHDGGVRIALRGEIDYTNAEGVAETVRAAIDDGRPVAVRLDLADVTFLDSSGIAVLVKAMKAAREAGAEFSVAGPRPRVLDQLRITGLTELFPVVDPLPGDDRAGAA